MVIIAGESFLFRHVLQTHLKRNSDLFKPVDCFKPATDILTVGLLSLILAAVNATVTLIMPFCVNGPRTLPYLVTTA